jgi:hypothetical protein
MMQIWSNLGLISVSEENYKISVSQEVTQRRLEEGKSVV